MKFLADMGISPKVMSVTERQVRVRHLPIHAEAEGEAEA